MIEAQLLLKNNDATLENIATMASLIAKAFLKTRFEFSGCVKTGGRIRCVLCDVSHQI